MSATAASFCYPSLSLVCQQYGKVQGLDIRVKGLMVIKKYEGQ
jgi:hypothetical protein